MQSECKFKYNEPCVHLIIGDDRDFCKRPSMFLCSESDKKPLMSHSARMNWTRCRQKYYFAQIVGIKVHDHMKSSPLKIGTVIDEFMRSRYMQYNFKDDYHKKCDELDLSLVDRAKTYAIIKAYFDLEVVVDTTGIAQYKCEYKTDNCHVTGYMDAFFGDHFEEIKASGRPDFYTSKLNLTSQLSTYFLAEPGAEYCDMKVIRVPQLKWTDKESIENYQKRLYSSIISRPSYYFIGWNKLSRTWFKRFYRNEFPIDAIRDDYEKMTVDILRAHKEGSFYQSFNCYVPFECDYLPICKTGGAVSDEIYTYRSQEEQ